MAEGKKFDGAKPDMSLIPVAAAVEEAGVWTFGKTKYGAHNWHNGIAYSRIIAAMERHLVLLKAGITFDYETARHHAASIRCGSGMIIQFDVEQRVDLDDRMKMSDEAKARIERMVRGELMSEILKDAK
jgi:hypothetical protein